MKKLFLVAALAIGTLSANAQEPTKQVYYGSEAGGFAISFNADPVLNYVGNMFNNSTSNTFGEMKGLGIESSLYNGVTISGKYFFLDNLAGKMSFGFNNTGNTTYRYSSSDPEKEVSKTTSSDHNFALALGVDYLLRPGQRLQPVVGASLIYAYSNTPYRFEDEDNNKVTSQGAPVNAFGLICNLGVEYFLCKQVSLSAEMDFSLMKKWEGSSVSLEGVKGDEYSRTDASSVYIKTAQVGAHIGINFYF